MTGRWPGEEVEGGEDGAGEDGQEGAAADGQDGNAAATVTSATTAGGASGSGEAAAHGEDVAMQDDPAEQDANGATTDAAAAPVDDAQDGPSEADLAAAPGTEANPSVAPPAAAENIADEAEEEEEDLPLFEPGQPWRSPGLTLLNLHRITTLHPSALNSLLAHSGPSLAHLNLHSCDELDGEALARLAREAKNLEVLDLSFVRAVDNFVVQDVLERMDKLRVLFLHGNNRVTSDVPRKVRSTLSLAGVRGRLGADSCLPGRQTARRSPARSRECRLHRDPWRNPVGVVKPGDLSFPACMRRMATGRRARREGARRRRVRYDCSMACFDVRSLPPRTAGGLCSAVPFLSSTG